MTDEVREALAARSLGIVTSYLEWNNAIWVHFFNPTSADQPITFALDDDELAAIARTLGIEKGRAPTEFLDGVRALARPGTKSVFGWWTKDPGRSGLSGKTEEYLPPTYIGLLGAAVLVASRMGDMSGQYDKFSYWPHFNDLVLGIESNKAPEGAHELDRLWRHLQQYLKDVCEGKLGLLSIQTVTEFTHINYPISQVILRSSDRLALRAYFDHKYPGRFAPSRSEVFELLRKDASEQQYPLSQVFRRLVLLRQGDEALLKALEEEVWLTFQHWAMTRNDRSSKASVVVSRPRIAEADDQVFPRSQVPSKAPTFDEARLQRVFRTDERQRLTWRLKLQPFGPAVTIEVSDDSLIEPDLLEAPTHDGWRQVRDRILTGDELRTGASLTSGDRDYYFAVRLPLIFEDTQFGWIQRDWLPVEHKICALVPADKGPELWQFASEVDEGATEISILEGDSHIDCVRFIIPSSVLQDQVPAFLGELQIAKPGKVQISGGLRINSSTFFLNAPPALFTDDPKLRNRVVTLNGIPLELPIQPGVPYPLRGELCKHGLNVAAIGELYVEFRAARESAGELDREAGIGFAVSRLFGTMLTELDAGGVKEKYLRNIRGFVIVGPYILPDSEY